jgi:hypothetical protein
MAAVSGGGGFDLGSVDSEAIMILATPKLSFPRNTRRHSDLMERLCVNSGHTELSFPPQHPQGNLPVVTTDG